ncbi:succinylglutamate desuccinylase/aspartoacylase family protein [Pareuzebyella sediminis]|uniref:succinylglutamate desuccinylase/aspartoacylase family protein n=1 Tax=Pareuzebyella sediminis TaxID=2607998 RepID=UPI0011EC9C7F|nr:succinylglutamate desuccinylase/aspartoacylase family protein [Pareuzebyella sediminis]
MTEDVGEIHINSAAKRIIGEVKGNLKGPTLVCFGGIHGNELAGVRALERVFEELVRGNYAIKGTVIGIRGNLPAQQVGKRFIVQDLNRLWTPESIENILCKDKKEQTSEEAELIELHTLVHQLLRRAEPPFYFIDLHTTSSQTIPFITINDALINRKFSQNFPVPIVLGIEEYINGPLLSHMNELGYVSLGFESGQHNGEVAICNARSFLWLSLVLTGLLNENDVPDFRNFYMQLQQSVGDMNEFYEVTHREVLTANDQFIMNSGFENFQSIKKGTFLGQLNGRQIQAAHNCILFMPLYQEQGEDAFFVLRRTPRWALWLSTFFRKIRLDSFLTLLPGISWSDNTKKSLLVDLNTARFFTKPFFHLLGYRNREKDESHFLMNNRERAAKNEIYKDEKWY